MDTFTLKINQYNNTAALYLNGERMEYYDEDIDLESDSFFMWAGCFWKVMEKATEGDYRLVVYGSEYEQMFLRDILTRSQLGAMAGQMEVEDVGQTIKYATIIVSTVPILCVYPFIQKHFVKGVMVGAVKE